MEVNFQYLWRQDSDPFYSGATSTHGPVTTQGYLLEAILSPQDDRSRWNLIGLYNRVNSTISEHWTGLDPFPARYQIDVESVALAVNYLLARNLRLLAEVDYDLLAGRARITAGVITAF